MRTKNQAQSYYQGNNSEYCIMTLICPKVSNLYLKFEDIAGVKNILVLCITETIIVEKKKNISQFEGSLLRKYVQSMKKHI